MMFLMGVNTPVYIMGKVGEWGILKNGEGVIFKWGVDIPLQAVSSNIVLWACSVKVKKIVGACFFSKEVNILQILMPFFHFHNQHHQLILEGLCSYYFVP